MIPRLLQGELLTQLNEYPIVTVLGPRQAGKTTLVRLAMPDFDYISLEDPDNRQLAAEDPRAFLKAYPDRVIFDEIQRAPHLLSYLQSIVDADNRTGRFVLTGSHQLELRAAISQSLAGRTGLLHLLPLSIAELSGGGITFDSFEHYAFNGFLPRIHDKSQRPRTAYANYYQTYVERDVRQLIKLKDAGLFEKFIKLLAGRVGQIMNHQSLANDVGVDGKTIKDWLSILEASFVVFKLSPYFENFGKRVIKSPKYYFIEPGLLVYLLDIEKPEQIARDPLLGSLFENLVVVEALKARLHRGRTANLYFFRDSHGNEIDLLHKSGGEMTGVEIKAAETWHTVFKASLKRFSATLHPLHRQAIIYRGKPWRFEDGVQAMDYRSVDELFGFA
ncbi:AAA family ATPase [Lamprobacter modestohalophilus]|uniref:AAA family ATPase n=1 Tax=Lamprobacter modestohalophilus TaxID=1064514 RepID=A0A9X1B394_9GAMM|nr:ATP-binding protein [Lamprobacter modestohalophilus]MBK1617357.1 AAA family ATPase [Lamprobacter modestohalophilus]